MVGFYNYTVYLTYFSLVSAFIGIYYSFENNSFAAALCLLICGLCDMFDGKIARTKKDRTKEEKRFGVQIDSLCDCVCFGIFPAVLGISIGADRWWQLAVSAFFAVCGVIRLAYYNVTEEERQNSTDEKRRVFLGVPITTSALIIPLLICFSSVLEERLAYLYTILLAAMGICFITPLKIKKPGKVGCSIMIFIGIAILICLIKKL